MKKRSGLSGIFLVLGFIFMSVTSCSNTVGQDKGLQDLKAARILISEGKLDEARDKVKALAPEFPDSGAIGKIYFKIAASYEKNKEYIKARDAYHEILASYQNVDNILEVQDNVGRLNIDILFSNIITDRDLLYEVEPGDTLLKIAKKFKTTVDLIKASNSLKDDMIQVKSRLKVSQARYKIFVDKSQNILTVFFDDGKIFKTYDVATGENNSTPIGTFKIINRLKDPVWYTQGARVPAESPDNILGSRWLGLSVEGYGIHGTVDPDSVGRQATQGCIRMLNEDVEELYVIIPTGIEVTIVD